MSPTLPDSRVPRAKMRVVPVQPELDVTPFSVSLFRIVSTATTLDAE